MIKAVSQNNVPAVLLMANVVNFCRFELNSNLVINFYLYLFCADAEASIFQLENVG